MSDELVFRGGIEVFPADGQPDDETMPAPSLTVTKGQTSEDSSATIARLTSRVNDLEAELAGAVRRVRELEERLAGG